MSCGKAIPDVIPRARAASAAIRFAAASRSPSIPGGYRWIQLTPKLSPPSGRRRSQSTVARASPSRRTTIPFISVPSTYSSRIASSLGETAIASSRWAETSAGLETRKTPNWPLPAAGLSTAGKWTSAAARSTSSSAFNVVNRGCGTPASASRRRMAILFVISFAVSVPTPGRPSASASRATIGTARSACTVVTPSISRSATASSTASGSAKSTTRPMSASASPGASGLRSIATTRSPSSRPRRITARW